jgi:hypothetical protein
MHLLVAVDKFTKWIEAQLISMIKSEQTMQFFLDNIHRFGVTHGQWHAVHREEIPQIL